MKRIIQIISLLCLFIVAQAVASLATLFLFNIPALFSQGIFDMNILVTSAWAMGFSLFLSCIFCIGGMLPLHAIDYERLLPNGNREKSFGYTFLLMLPSIFLINLFCESLSLEDINKDIFSLMMYNPLGVASIVLFGPFTEELIFRMGIQTGLVKAGLSPLQAIVAGALIFGPDTRSRPFRTYTGLALLAFRNHLDSGCRTCHEQPDRRGTRMAYRQYGPDTGGTLRRHMAGCSMCHTLGHTVRMGFPQTSTHLSGRQAILLKDAERPTYLKANYPSLFGYFPSTYYI